MCACSDTDVLKLKWKIYGMTEAQRFDWPDVFRGKKGKWQCRERICSLWKFWHFISVCKEMPGLWWHRYPGSHACLNPTSASNLLDDLILEVAVLKMALFSVPFWGRQIWFTFKTESPWASSHFANVLILVSLHLQIPPQPIMILCVLSCRCSRWRARAQLREL